MISKKEQYDRYAILTGLIDETYTSQLLQIKPFKKNPNRAYSRYLRLHKEIKLYSKRKSRLRRAYPFDDTKYRTVIVSTRFKDKLHKVRVGPILRYALL
jgi:hypothetical protein